MKKSVLIAKIENEKARSAWAQGVKEYALELAENLSDDFQTVAFIDLLNGATDWSQYSWGGSSLIYDSDICERLCSPSEQKRRRGGEWRPNQYEEWLDVQARALRQAAGMVRRLAREV